MSDVRLFSPGTDEYARGTQPHNSSAHQHPALVGAPRDAQQMAAIVREAARRGLQLLPQATGHGAGGEVGEDTVIVDTSGLTDLAIDADARVATAGAGLTWGAVNARAEEHGLLGLAGSSPSVCVSGYTFGGGLGWLTRPHGMASSALRAVEYVDGAGAVRTASEEAESAEDREALWAFRGGGGVGIATRLTFDLVPVTDLRAGYLLWPAAALASVVEAWADSLGRIGDDVSTSLSLLHAPPAPPFPEDLRGQPLLHLAVAASTGEDGALPLLDAVRRAAAPAVDTWGPADVERLGGIHLDPPPGTPAIGDARWLGADAPAYVRDVLTIAAPEDSPLAMVEFRHVGNESPARPGAVTGVPGPYVVHAVCPLPDPAARPAVDEALAQIRAAVAPVDLGRSLGSWVEGAASVPDALPPEVRARVVEIAEAVDPDRVVRRTRHVS